MKLDAKFFKLFLETLYACSRIISIRALQRERQIRALSDIFQSPELFDNEK